MKKTSNCIICKKRLKGKQTKYCSLVCKNRSLQSYPAQKERGLKKKLYLLNIFGNKCSLCGYSKNISALTFHHKYSNKEFKLDARSLSNRTFEKISKEIKKCILVCQNCHAEIHNPNLSLDKLSVKPTALTTELRAQKLKCYKNSIAKK